MRKSTTPETPTENKSAGQDEGNVHVPMSQESLKSREVPVKPFDPSRYRLSQDFAGATGVQEVITTIDARRPGKQVFFKIHAQEDHCLATAVLEVQEEKDVYLVDPSLWDHLRDELVPKILFTGITRAGDLFVYSIRLPDALGKLDSWNQSAREAVELAKKNWVRLVPDMAQRRYRVLQASSDLGPPAWPALSFEQIWRSPFVIEWSRTWPTPSCDVCGGKSDARGP